VDRRQLMFAALVGMPAMLVGTLVIMIAARGGGDTEDPLANDPTGITAVQQVTTSGPVTSSAPGPASATSTISVAPQPTASAPPAGENPFEHGIYGSHPHAGKQAAAWQASRPADAALLARMGRTPTATWFGDWIPDVRAAADTLVSAAAKSGGRPVLVAYNLPGRDCEGYSGGGAANENAYRSWVRALAAGIGDRPAAVILEPDALGHLCGDATARYRMLNDAVAVLEAGAKTDVYLDAGHPKWLDAKTAAQRLRSAGVTKARGFALNVANFVTTAENERYGEEIVRALGTDTHYVIDTSRNGNGEGSDWCNPPGRALGPTPTANTAGAHADAYLWIKIPGESDGTCGGAPAAGTWMPEYALGLAKAAR
jgi:endoglucanase